MQINKFLHHIKRLLTPGIGLKRWLLVLFVGITLISIGFTVFALDLYRDTSIRWLRKILVVISLAHLPRWLRMFVYGSVGLIFLAIGLWNLNKSILKPFIKPGQQFVDTISNYRRKERGPRVVAIGGGNGLAALLRGLKKYSHNITAIVTVADDGGSSGELRKNLGILPPGDIRNCLTALADDEEMLSHVFKYRFGKRAGVNGHSLGNLFISALTDITGSFEEAVAESGKVLAIKGRVIPSTLHDVKLVAEINMRDYQKEVKVVGESVIPKVNGSIERVWLDPNTPSPFPPAIQAILSADLIIIGPGSLYTSLIPNLLVPDIAKALLSSKGMKFYVCNVANQHGETDEYTCLDHIHAIEKHVNGIFFDFVVCNDNFETQLPKTIQHVLPGKNLQEEYSAYMTSLSDPTNPWRHDSEKLAEVILDLFYEKTGPLPER